MLIRREVLLAKVEDTYNTDASPDAADDAKLVENLAWANEGAVMTERNPVRPSLAPLQQVFGGVLRTVTFDVELKGPGAAYSSTDKPEIGTLLRGCAFSETIDTTADSEKVTYEPASSGHESLTLYYYQDGQLIKMTGARGNVTFQVESGIPAKASFTFTGHTSTPTDDTLPSPTYDSTVPAPVLDGSFTIDSYSAKIATLSFDMSNQLSMPKDINAADGFGDIQITGRDVNGSFDPLAVLVATHPFEDNWRSGKSMALNLGTIGSTQYNQFAITMPAVYYREIAPGDREGIRSYEMTFGAVESSGGTDDEVSIQFS